MTWLYLTVAAIGIKVVADELLDWFPWVAEQLIRRAARRLPGRSQERYLEEWLAELDVLPGRGVSKILFASRILWNASGVREAVGDVSPPRATRPLIRVLDVCGGTIALVLVLPVMLYIAALIRMSGRPVFVYSAEVLNGEIVKSGWRFRTFSWRATEDGSYPTTTFGRFLTDNSLDQLPMLVDVLRGRRSLFFPGNKNPPTNRR